MPIADEPDHLFFTELVVENVRAFAQRQVLCLADAYNHPVPWTLILGENGVGKTTLLQALARMRPVPAFKRSDKHVGSSVDAGVPDRAEPELSRHDDPEISKLIRLGNREPTSIQATLTAAGFKSRRGRKLKVGVVCEAKGDRLTKIHFAQAKHELHSEGPLVIGYGAGRRIGHSNIPVVIEGDFTASLFAEGVDLFDAEEILEKMHYASLTPRSRRLPSPKVRAARKRLGELKEAVAALIPDLAAEDIDIRGPRVPSRSRRESGVHVTTPSGPVPFSELSLGYQTVFAWTVDLAWRMFTAYPNSKRPLSQAAIVLIDEVDLHLHPRWQRLVRSHLRKHFPNVQFIATTHSPLTAQETLAAGGNIVVVRWEGNQAVILNRPIPNNEWRVDQLLTSDLFGFDSARGPRAEKLMSERILLVRKKRRTSDENRRLKELDDYVLNLPTSASPSEQKFEDLMRKVARLEKIGSLRAP
jgi:energy-coupling factor transporter ATP-binding protein EcfA2